MDSSTPPESQVTTAEAGLRQPVAVHKTDGVLRIGRHDGNDIVLPDLRSSKFHAEVRRVGDAYQIKDLGSTNGVHLNGRRVVQAPLATGDRVSVGRHDFVFDGEHLHEYVDMGPSSLFADDLTVQVGKQTLLDDVSFAVNEGSLVGVIGPSGCGKSTLIKAITGLRPANQGRVHYDGRSLYEEYADLRYRIGMVPQDDVLHRQLTVRTALRFAASLRFADDVPRKQRLQRVDEVIAMLGLSERANQRISTLSGGQRKRTSVALELLTEPSLLCLDEPTSGLDPALDREVMRELRNLADRGRTVMVVTHSVLHLAMCDRVLVMCQGGRMGFFGPPDEVLEFFGASDYADVFEMITNDPMEWAVKYRNSDAYRSHVGQVVLQMTERQKAATLAVAAPAPVPAAPVPGAAPAAGLASAAPPAPAATGLVPTQPGPADVADAADAADVAVLVAPAESGPASAAVPEAGPADGAAAVPEVAAGSGAPPAAAGAPRLGRNPLKRPMVRNPVAPVRQFFTLSARMVAVIFSDRGYTAFIVGLPLVLALLTHSVPGTNGLGVDTGFTLEAQRLLVVLVVGAAFMGIAGAIREIVSEGPIYDRERAVGVSPGAYLCSKLLVYLIIDVLQVSLFTKLALLGRPGPAAPLVFHSWPMVEIIVPIALVAFVSTVLGLLVSALVRTIEQTTPVLVVAVMAQLVLSGGLFELPGGALEQVSWISPSRWGFAAGASTVNLSKMVPFSDHLWAHTESAWWRSIGWMLLAAVILAALTRLALKRHDPGKTK